MMKVSVALCTYNGEKFLKEQIDSILSQTIPVDEIVVCDDRSTDLTINILNSYREKHPNIFKIIVNDENLKSVKNFEKAISICKNEIIFLSDQDDVWIGTKVERILCKFEENTNISVIATNGYGIDDQNNILDVITIWDVPSFVVEKGFEFNYYNILNIIGNFCTGATMAIKADFKKDILPIPNIPGFHHDEWIAIVSARKKELYFLDEKLLYYRAHQSQQVGGVFYKNNKKEKESLTNFFSIDRADKSFKDYKRLLKRFSSAYKKNKFLQQNHPGFEDYFSNNLAEIKREFLNYKLEMIKQFPIQSFLLNISDTITEKRKI